MRILSAQLFLSSEELRPFTEMNESCLVIIIIPKVMKWSYPCNPGVLILQTQCLGVEQGL